MNKLSIIAFCLFLAACQAGDVLSVQDPWVRAAAAGENTGVFFTLENGAADDVLLSVVCDAAAAAEIHETVMDGDIMRMQMQESVQVPAGRLEFKPGGLHVMLIGLKSGLAAGDTILLTLNFETAGPVTIQAEVRQP